MSDNREAYPIQWNAPAPDGAAPSWNGPRPDAQLPPQQEESANPSAPQGYPSEPEQPSEPVGWAGSASTGNTAEEISTSHPQDAGYGWSSAGGSSRFDAPDRDDHAPRRESPASADVSDSAPAQQPSQEHDAQGPAASYVSAPPQSPAASYVSAPPQSPGGSYASAPPQNPAGSYVSNQPQSPAAPEASERPASYAPAPQQGTTGSGAHEPWGGQSYESAPPQVVGQHDDLPEDSLTIGRSRVNSIVLDDMLVSRRHVVITADDEGLLLRDLGSRNGTFVNGRRVEQTHLHEGDRIGIGASTFEVRDGWLVSV